MWPVSPFQIVVAMVGDILIGDPQGWPHIARISGALSVVYESWLTRCFRRTVLSGILFWVLVVATMVAGYLVLRFLCCLINPALGYVFDIVIIYQTLAARDLQKHVTEVVRPLLMGDLVAARKRLSWIVGRDTETLDQSEISRAAIESVAESLVDGVVAPLFWSALGGALGGLIYRVANTLDSTVGHRSHAYEKFGKASARIDDVLNWVPARVCALLLCLFGALGKWAAVRREAALHLSPNAGWSEAAMAYALGVRLGGSNFYDGECVEMPVFNASGRVAMVEDIRSSLSRLWLVVFVAGAFFMLLSAVLL